jgi:GNAT superfamily N-acetyltransferase
MTNLNMIYSGTLNEIGQDPFPEGFHVRMYQQKTDRDVWCQLIVDTGMMDTPDQANRYFDQTFLPHLALFRSRCFFLVDDHCGATIGTTTAWFADVAGETIGQIHFVGILPAYQGRKLSRPLVKTALRTSLAHYERTFLITQPYRITAISLYLSIGFVPWIKDQDDRTEWNQVMALLGKKQMEGIR